jgi:dTDP-4-dehydrorhamnose 3,5-epimerase
MGRLSMAEGRYGAPNVVGSAELLAKKSAVDEHGHLRSRLVDGVVFRPTRSVPHEDGFLTEVARASWDALDKPVTQVHITTTFPARIRAWGLHQASVDRLFVVSGLVKIVVFDGRLDSPTHGHYTELVASERNPGLLTIPPDLYHGWKNIGVTEAIIINMPSEMYNYEDPDALDMPWDSPAARELIPYTW